MTGIDAETKSLMLVGRFLKQLCDLEERLNETIAAVLGIDDTKRFILCANIHFREKIGILRSFLHTSNMSESDQQQLDTELKKMGDLYRKRNTLAHQPFRPARDGDGITFSIVHVKGGSAPLEENWTEVFFSEIAKTVEEFVGVAARLRNALAGGEFIIRRRDLDWLNQNDVMTMRRMTSPGLWTALDPQNQWLPGYHAGQANPKKDNQTPDKPQE